MMTTDNEPMSDERLAEIRRRIDPNYDRSMLNTYAIEARNDRIALFAEVDRLRAALEQEQREHGNCEDYHFRMSQTQLQALVALAEQNAAMRAIVEAVESYATLKRYMDSCEWCGCIGQSVDVHTPDCPVTKARVLLEMEANNGK